MSTLPLRVGAERRRHPTYRHTVYWGEVLSDDHGGRAIFQIGPFRHRADAIAAAIKERDRRDVACTAKRRAELPLTPTRPQEPCDLGLFSDESSQMDLVDLARQR